MYERSHHSYTDRNVGTVMAALDGIPGLLSSTVVMLIGDHGWSLGEQVGLCTQAPLPMDVPPSLPPCKIHTVRRRVWRILQGGDRSEHMVQDDELARLPSEPEWCSVTPLCLCVCSTMPAGSSQ